jgi:site-specific DNA-methyltransferase (adenine-specific)
VNLAWDAVELDTIAAQEGIDLDGWGVPKDVLKEPVEEVEVEEDDFDEEKDAVETICQEGDVWQLGEHRLMCGDSTKAEDVARLMNGELADLWLTDPPYNVAYEGGTKDALTIENDSMASGAFRAFLTDAFKAATARLKPGGAFYIWHADSEGFNFRVALHDTPKLLLKQCLVWVKNTFVLGRQDYQWKHEPCLYGWKDGASHYFVGERTHATVVEEDRPDLAKMSKAELLAFSKELLANRDAMPTSAIYEDKPARNAEHPTMKPVKLFARLIRNSSRMGEVVLDTFGGSGTTIVACEQLARRARLMELDPHYCDVIIARWEKLTGKTANRLSL